MDDAHADPPQGAAADVCRFFHGKGSVSPYAMDRPAVVVAVAFSAGDFEPVSELLSALPAAYEAAFIVVQSLESSREKLLFETLRRTTVRPVTRPNDGVIAEQGTVYVTTADMVLTMTGGRICVTPRGRGLHHPGDVLFTSLAEQRGHGAIGVALSGEGSDGALGIRAIRQSGGATLAQHPGSARFPSMPINAIETGCVGFVARPNEIAHELVRLSSYRAAA